MPGPRFRAAAPNYPEALLEEPQAFQAVGEKYGAEQHIDGILRHYKLQRCSYRRITDLQLQHPINPISLQ